MTVAHRAGVLTDQQISHLVRGPTRSKAEGKIKWSVRHPRLKGTLGVVTPLDGDCRVAQLQITARAMKPTQPRLQYLVGGVAAVRFDVNDEHDHWGRCSHIHWYRPDGGEHVEKADLGLSLPIDITPTSADFRIVIETFAAYLQVELPSDWWHPWNERWEPWTR